MDDKVKIERFDPYVGSANLGPKWERWLSSFELYADSKGMIIEEIEVPTEAQARELKRTGLRRRASLFYLAGQDVHDIFITLPDGGESHDYKKAVVALDKYFKPKSSSHVARQEFHKQTPRENESVQQFATRLRTAARDCEFVGVEKENSIRDKILWTCRSEYVKKRLYEEQDGLTLEKTLKLAEQCERVEEQMGQGSVNRVTYQQGTQERKHGKKQFQRTSQHQNDTNAKQDGATKGQCYRCGRSGHYSRDTTCPARGQECRKCSRVGHFSNMCKTKQINSVNDENDENDENVDYAFHVSASVDKDCMIMLNVGGVKLDCMIDSGASTNIISEGTWETLKSKKIECISKIDPLLKLLPYGSSVPLQVKGSFTCKVKVPNFEKTDIDAKFVVVKGQGIPLLGKETAFKLGVLKVGINAIHAEDLAKQYPEVFTGMGKLKDTQVKLHVDPDFPPVAQPLRRTPFQLRERVEQKLNEMIEQDIIETVQGPTPWVNPIVVVPKANNEIRLTLDMRRANEAIIRERHPIPTVDEILEQLGESRHFSELDLNSAYFQIELEPESRGITTFATHVGLFRFKRLVMGVSSASEVFQHKVGTALAGIEGVVNISDNIVVHGGDKETHDERLHSVLKRLREVGLTLNSKKCQIGLSELDFFGYLISEKGIGPSEARVKAVLDACEPTCAQEIRSFLGMIQYSARFIPEFSTISDPLRELTRQGAKFEFGDRQKAAFSKLKECIAKAIVLAHYDRNAPTKIIADASPVGIAGILIQDQRDGPVVISYASRCLSDVERRYSQTEKEALGLVWACEKFHTYVYGKKFILVTDHQPLEKIYGPRSKPCARIERWVLRLQAYDFKVQYIRGKYNIADSLSRLLSAKRTIEDKGNDTELHVRFVAVNATPKTFSTHEIELISAEDSELKVLRLAIETGNFENCKTFKPISEELCVMGQIVLRGTRILMPEKLRPRVLALAHEGHLGIVGTKQALRAKVWWPGLDRAVEKYCRACHGCQLVARADPPEPLKPTVLPDEPWADLGTDLLGPLPSGHSILVCVDYYSRYYEYDILKSTTTDKVIDSLDEMFARHGVPKTVKSDNGPQFKSGEFAEYCSENGITHLKVTAKYAQANGEVERQNRSILKRLQIAQAEKLDWRRELRKYVAKYRSIPHATTNKSPAELLFNRKMRNKIPGFTQDPTPDFEVRDADAEQKGKSKIYTDERRGARPSDVDVGDVVLVKQDKTNKLSTNFNEIPHTVVEKKGNSLVVENPTGSQYSRNTTHVRKYVNDTCSNEMVQTDHVVQNDPIVQVENTTNTKQVEMNITERPKRNVQKPERYRDGCC